jgi:hypothetical protein
VNDDEAEDRPDMWIKKENMTNSKVVAFVFAVGIALPAAHAQVCTGNREAALYFSSHAPAALYQAGQISLAPSRLQEILRFYAVAQIKAAVTWLESCPGAVPVTLTPETVCTYTTPSFFAQYVLQEWTTFQDEGLDFAEEPDAPLDTGRVNQILAYLQQAYGLMAPCITASS